MNDEIREKWFAYWSPLVLGFTANGHANGLLLTLGAFWARAKGGHNLYRWTDDEVPDDLARVVGAASARATEITTFSFIRHESSTAYRYLLRAVGGGGVEESTMHQLRVVAFDASGAMIGPRPNRPSGLCVDALAGGRFRLHWWYEPIGQEAAPARFEIYNDASSPGVVDFSSSVAEIVPVGSAGLLTWTSPAFDDHVRVCWAVRAVAANGADDGNEIGIAAIADASGPPVLGDVVHALSADMP